MGKCNWCGHDTELVENRKYCHMCSECCVQECVQCHRPFNDLRFFELSKIRCNACERKRLKCERNYSTYKVSVTKK